MKDYDYTNIKREKQRSCMVKCPNCGHEFYNVLKCLRCGHSWRPREDKLPTVCPNTKCKSPYWNKPRQTKKTDKNKVKK